MNQLTAGELAQLFNTSKYKIRHYIDKGILTPKRNTENNYYIFEESDIYRLYQINTLREIGLSIKEIQESLELDNMISMFEEAEAKIQQDINKLLVNQKTINKIINAQKEFELNKIIFVDREERYYKKLTEQVIEKNSIDYAKAVKQEIPHLDEPYYVLSKNQSPIICLTGTKESNDYVFSNGTYACKSFVVKSEMDIEEQVNLFLSDLTSTMNDSSTKDILLYENIYCSLAYNDKMFYSIEVRI